MKIKEAFQKMKDNKNKMVIEIHKMGVGHAATITTWLEEPERIDEYLQWTKRDDVRIVERDKHFRKIGVWMKSERLAQYVK